VTVLKAMMPEATVKDEVRHYVKTLQQFGESDCRLAAVG
jgi:hypothetical protein